MAKRGSAKPPPKILLNWSFRFWDIDPGSALPRGKNLAGKGFEKQSKTVEVVLTDESQGPAAGDKSVKAKQLKDTELRELTDARNTGRYDMHILVPAGHDSGGPAGPTTDSPKPSALWNRTWEIQFRSSVFRSLEIDSDGFFVVDGNDEFVTCEVEDIPENEGVPPHAVLRIFKPEGSGKKRQQRIDVDIRFDVLRPTENRLTKKNGGDVWLDAKTGQRTSGRVTFDRFFIVVHCTGHVPESDRPTKKPDWRVGTSYIGTQLQTLTARAAIHYLVNIDGHVVKIVEEDRWAHQAGFDPRSESEEEADKADGVTKNPYGGCWRDFVFSAPPRPSEDDPDPADEDEDGNNGADPVIPDHPRFQRGAKARANQPSIGIEHVAGEEQKWPQAQIDGSIRLIRAIRKRKTIKSCDVVRHRDLCFKAKRSTTGHELKTHHPGKVCPGAAVPWKEYQDAKVVLWPKGEIPDEADEKMEFEKADVYGGVFELLDTMDAKLPDTATDAQRETQTAAITQLQDDIERIGYWCLTKNRGNAGSYDEALTHCVNMVQERFMTARGIGVGKKGKVDWETAKTIQRILAHGPDQLP